jgi:spectrin beta
VSDLAVLVFLRFTEKGNLEVLLFTIQSKMRANNQKVYIPREGKLISDINKVSL